MHSHEWEHRVYDWKSNPKKATKRKKAKRKEFTDHGPRILSSQDILDFVQKYPNSPKMLRGAQDRKPQNFLKILAFLAPRLYFVRYLFCPYPGKCHHCHHPIYPGHPNLLRIPSLIHSLKSGSGVLLLASSEPLSRPYKIRIMQRLYVITLLLFSALRLRLALNSWPTNAGIPGHILFPEAPQMAKRGRPRLWPHRQKQTPANEDHRRGGSSPFS